MSSSEGTVAALCRRDSRAAFRRALALATLLALPLAAQAQTDDPMIRWDCDPVGNRLVLETVQVPVAIVTERERIFFSGETSFHQCRLDGASWTLLVDLVEYETGRCAVEPDTIVSLLRNDRLVISSVVIGHNCGERPVLSAARIAEQRETAETKLELCTAKTFGAEHRCSELSLGRVRAAIDNAEVAAHANGATAR